MFRWENNRGSQTTGSYPESIRKYRNNRPDGLPQAANFEHARRMNTKVESFEDLETYQAGCALDLAIFDLTKSWPKEEMYSLTDQIRRSSRSVGANIAEAWAKRRYPAHFTSKLTDADAELQETEHWLLRAKAYGYLEAKHFDDTWQSAKHVGRLLGGMMKSGDWS